MNRPRELYRRALALDPNLIDASTNLGVLEAQSGHLSEAVKLWQGAFQRAPGRSSSGMNLARAFLCSWATKGCTELHAESARVQSRFDLSEEGVEWTERRSAGVRALVAQTAALVSNL